MLRSTRHGVTCHLASGAAGTVFVRRGLLLGQQEAPAERLEVAIHPVEARVDGAGLRDAEAAEVATTAAWRGVVTLRADLRWRIGRRNERRRRRRRQRQPGVLGSDGRAKGLPIGLRHELERPRGGPSHIRLAASRHGQRPAPRASEKRFGRSSAKSGTIRRTRSRTSLNRVRRAHGFRIAMSHGSSGTFARALQMHPIHDEPVIAVVVVADSEKLGDTPVAAITCDVHHMVNRQRNRFPRAAVRQADVGGQHAVPEPRQRLLRCVGVNGAETAKMPRVQRLQQIERLSAADFADQNAVRTMPQCGAQQIGNGHGREGCFLTERCLCPSRLESHAGSACRW